MIGQRHGGIIMTACQLDLPVRIPGYCELEQEYPAITIVNSVEGYAPAVVGQSADYFPYLSPSPHTATLADNGVVEGMPLAGGVDLGHKVPTAHVYQGKEISAGRGDPTYVYTNVESGEVGVVLEEQLTTHSSIAR